MTSSDSKKVNDNLYETYKVEKWNDLLEFPKNLVVPLQSTYGWTFRGQKKNKEWDLQSSLEEAFELFKPDKKFTRSSLEKALIREFKRKVFLYTNHPPTDELECLALMRHYGAPTRFLDWTYSFYAAAYFAVGTVRSEKDSCEIWALDAGWFSKEAERLIGGKKKVTKLTKKLLKEEGYPSKKCSKSALEPTHRGRAIVSYLMDEPTSLIIGVNPFRLNERLRIQQGLFLCPGDINQSFPQNLNAIAKKGFKNRLWKISIEADIREILKGLCEMNITEATLFPDLDGFARSLRHLLAFPETLGSTLE